MQSSSRYNVYENTAATATHNNNNNDDDDDDESRNSDILGDAPDEDVDDNVFDDTGPSPNTTSVDNSMSDEQIHMFSNDFKQSLRTDNDNSITPSCSSNSSSSVMIVPANIPTRQPILSTTSNSAGSQKQQQQRPSMHHMNSYSPGPLIYHNSSSSSSQRLPSSSTFHSSRESTSSTATTKYINNTPASLTAHSTGNVNAGHHHHTLSPKKMISKAFQTVNSAVAQRFPNNPYLLNKQPSLSTSSTKKLNNSPVMRPPPPPVVSRTRCFQVANSSLLVASSTNNLSVNASIAASQHSLVSTGKSSGRVQFLELGPDDQLNQSAKAHCLPVSMANFFHFDVQSVLFSYNEIKAKKGQITSSGNMLSGASAASRNNMNDSSSRNYSSASQFSYSSGQESQPSVVNPGISPSTSDEHTLIKPSKVHLYLSNESPSPYSSDSPSTPNESCRQRAHLAPSRTSISSASIQHLTSQNCVNLVDECPFFQVEVGGDVFKGLGIVQDVSQRRLMQLNSISLLNKENINYKPNVVESMDMSDHETFPIEYVDWGSYFYRYYFCNHEHANYLGVDRDIGPIVISIRREKILVDYDPLVKSPPSKRGSGVVLEHHHHKTTAKERILDYVYRIIIRTSDLTALRGTVSEEYLQCIKNSSKIVSHKEIISWFLPELDLSCLRLGDCKESKLSEALLDFDELDMNRNYKVGVLLCKADQTCEEEMYNNRETTPDFEEFLKILGDKVTLRNFGHFCGGLDTTADTTGTHAVYAKYQEREIMFHVSTLLPFTPNDKQQVSRKRHIGNDLVTVIFQEYGSLPFTPKNIRSHFQHVFIVVRAMVAPQLVLAGRSQKYSVAVSYSKDMPHFGPPLPKNPLFVKSKEFRDFLLAKIINADNAGLRCKKLVHLKLKSRHGVLGEIVAKYSTKLTLENCGSNGNGSNSGKFVLFNFGNIKQKKIRSKSLQMFNAQLLASGNDSLDAVTSTSLYQLNDGLFWSLENIEDSTSQFKNCCYFGVSKQNIVVVDASKKSVIFSISCNAVIGWTVKEGAAKDYSLHGNKSKLQSAAAVTQSAHHQHQQHQLVLYFDQGEYVVMTMRSKQDLHQATKRLEYFTKGCRTVELNLDKKDCGQLGFKIHNDGVVTEVEPNSIAYCQGLRQGTRIVKICDYYVIRLSHQKMLDLFRHSTCLKVSFLPPQDDGNARRGRDDGLSLYLYLSTCSALNNERSIDSRASFISADDDSVFEVDRVANNLVKNVNGPRHSPHLCVDSPTFSRLHSQSTFRTNDFTSSSSKSNGANVDDYLPSRTTVKRSTRCSGGVTNSSEEFSRHLDPRTDSPPQIEWSLPMTYSQKVRLNSSGGGGNPTNCAVPSHSARLPPVPSASHRAVRPSHIDYQDLIRKSTLPFKKVHPDIDYESNSSKPSTPLTSKNFLFAANTEPTEPNPLRPSNFPSLNGHHEQKNNMASAVKERKLSFDELEEKYLRLQRELNQEKKDRDLATSRVEQIAKENNRLKSEVSKLKDENKQLCNKLSEHTFIISQAMNSSRTNSTSGTGTSSSRGVRYHNNNNNSNKSAAMSFDVNVNSLV